MRARWLVAMFIALLGAVVVAQASAQVATQSSQVQMQGQAQVDQSGRVPRLLISTDSADNSVYHLDAALSPAATSRQPGRENERGEREGRSPGGQSGSQPQRSSGGTGLVGNFTLSHNGTTVAGGQATGQLNRDGTGSLNLADNSGSFNMQLDFAVQDQLGTLDATLSGQIPQASGQTQSNGAGAAIAGEPTVTASTNNDHTFWYLARAAGLSAYLMLFLNVVFGLAVHTKVMDKIYARWKSLDLHQFTTLLALGLLAIHGLALLGDHYIGFSMPEILVPLLSPYRPLWTAIGIIAAYLVGLVAASSYLRKHMSYSTWRSLHYLSFGAYVLALGHGIMAGTDTSQPWAQAMYWSTGAIIAVLMVWRFRRSHAPAPQRAPVQAGEPMRRGVS